MIDLHYQVVFIKLTDTDSFDICQIGRGEGQCMNEAGGIIKYNHTGSRDSEQNLMSFDATSVTITEPNFIQ